MAAEEATAVRELRACPACGGESSTRVPLDHEHELRRCTACDLVHARRYADPDAVYVDGYLSGGTDYGLDIFDPVFQEFLDFAADRRLDRIEAVRSPGRLVDVGCGSGEVLRAAQRRGWEVAGAEPVEESARIARERGLDVRTAVLESSGLEPGTWDVVTAFHVLEHMPDGVGFLRSISRWARPGGLVVVEVPNWASRDREAHGPRWSALRPLEHVAHYTPDTMERVLTAAGLELVSVGTLGFLWDRQSLGERLDNLGRDRWRRPLRPLCRQVDRGGRTIAVPRRSVERALLAVQAGDDRRRRGQVVLGIARVPA